MALLGTVPALWCCVIATELLQECHLAWFGRRFRIVWLLYQLTPALLKLKLGLQSKAFAILNSTFFFLYVTILVFVSICKYGQFSDFKHGTFVNSLLCYSLSMFPIICLSGKPLCFVYVSAPLCFDIFSLNITMLYLKRTDLYSTE